MSIRLIDEHPELVRVGKQDMPKAMKRDSMRTKIDYCFLYYATASVALKTDSQAFTRVLSHLLAACQEDRTTLTHLIGT